MSTIGARWTHRDELPRLDRCDASAPPGAMATIRAIVVDCTRPSRGAQPLVFCFKSTASQGRSYHGSISVPTHGYITDLIECKLESSDSNAHADAARGEPGLGPLALDSSWPCASSAITADIHREDVKGPCFEIRQLYIRKIRPRRFMLGRDPFTTSAGLSVTTPPCKRQVGRGSLWATSSLSAHRQAISGCSLALQANRRCQHPASRLRDVVCAAASAP